MKIQCSVCHRDLNEIYQDNMSDESNRPLCEDCADARDFWQEALNYDLLPKRRLSKKQFKFLMKYAGWHYLRVKNTPYDVAVDKISRIIYMMKQKTSIKKK